MFSSVSLEHPRFFDVHYVLKVLLVFTVVFYGVKIPSYQEMHLTLPSLSNTKCLFENTHVHVDKACGCGNKE